LNVIYLHSYTIVLTFLINLFYDNKWQMAVLPKSYLQLGVSRSGKCWESLAYSLQNNLQLIVSYVNIGILYYSQHE
jgi:hypothetical protein